MTLPAELHAAPTTTARRAGLAYAGIIVLGISSEMLLRAPLAADLSGAGPALRHSVAMDAVMLVLDVALALALWRLLAPFGAVLALAAMLFRLMQAAVIGAGLVLLQAAALIPDAGLAPEEAERWLRLGLAAHAGAYDLGLIFFAVSTGLIAQLLCRAGVRWLAMLLIAAAAVYLAGSLARFLAPGLVAGIAPAYVIPLLAEMAFCGMLLAGRIGHR